MHNRRILNSRASGGPPQINPQEPFDSREFGTATIRDKDGIFPVMFFFVVAFRTITR